MYLYVGVDSLIIVIIIHGIDTGHIRVVLCSVYLVTSATRAFCWQGRKPAHPSPSVPLCRFVVGPNEHVSWPSVIGNKVLKLVTTDDACGTRAISYFNNELWYTQITIYIASSCELVFQCALILPYKAVTYHCRSPR